MFLMTEMTLLRPKEAKGKETMSRSDAEILQKWNIFVNFSFIDEVKPVDEVNSATDIIALLMANNQPLYPFDIIMETCSLFSVDVKDVLGHKSVSDEVQNARHVAVFLLENKYPSPQLGSHMTAYLLNRRNTAFVNHCIFMVKDSLRREPDGDIARAINSISKKLS